MKIPLFFLVALALLGTSSCQEVANGPEKANWAEVEKSWSGAAELSRYELKQNRYGEIRKGESILIFVREPFLRDRQVKDESGRGNFHALKMNSTRNFLTGLYPYSTMVSVFQPLEENSAGKALKVTTSVQDWCGHVFMQSNRRDGVTKTELNSYFESEEGGSFQVKASVLLEDEIWTALRLNPLGLPVGEVQLVPGSLNLRFSHREPRAEPAKTRWLEGKPGKTVIYEITYPQSGRTLAIEIQKKLPYAIEGWHESSGQTLISSGKLVAREANLDYWNYNETSRGNQMRKKLGLKP